MSSICNQVPLTNRIARIEIDHEYSEWENSRKLEFENSTVRSRIRKILKVSLLEFVWGSALYIESKIILYKYPLIPEATNLLAFSKTVMIASTILFIPFAMKYIYDSRKEQDLRLKRKSCPVPNNDQPLSSSHLSAILRDPKYSDSLKIKIIKNSSSQQLFELARSDIDIRSKLTQLMPKEEKNFILFLLNPECYEPSFILCSLSQYKEFFAKHPQILNFLIDRITAPVLEKDLTSLLQDIRELQVENAIPMSDNSEEIQRLLSLDKVEVHIGAQIVRVSRTKLLAYDPFEIYFRANDTTDAAHTTAWNLSIIEKSDSGNLILHLPLDPDQDEEILVSLLNFIESGELPDSDIDLFSLYNEADCYGVSRLTEYCADRIVSGMSDSTKEEKADLFSALKIPYKPLPQCITAIIENEWCMALSRNNIEDFHFWLDFAQANQIILTRDFWKSIDSWDKVLFSNDIPSAGIEFISYVFEKKYEPLLTQLMEEIANNWCGENLIAYLEKFSHNEDLCLEIAEKFLEKYKTNQYKLNIWAFACRHNFTKVRQRAEAFVHENPTIEECTII